MIAVCGPRIAPRGLVADGSEDTAGGIEDGERREQLAIEATVAGNQPVGLNLGVSADQEVRKDAGSRAALLTVLPPDSACQEMRVATQRLDADFVALEKPVALLPGWKMNTQLGINQIADRQGSFRGGVFQHGDCVVDEAFVG